MTERTWIVIDHLFHEQNDILITMNIYRRRSYLDDDLRSSMKSEYTHTRIYVYTQHTYTYIRVYTHTRVYMCVYMHMY